MSEAKQIIPKGALFTLTTGAYSDYYIRGVFRALKEIHSDDLLAEWFAEHPEQTNAYNFKDYDFLGWVARKGLLEPLDSFEWHLDGTYQGASSQVSGPDICALSN